MEQYGIEVLTNAHIKRMSSIWSDMCLILLEDKRATRPVKAIMRNTAATTKTSVLRFSSGVEFALRKRVGAIAKIVVYQVPRTRNPTTKESVPRW